MKIKEINDLKVIQDLNKEIFGFDFSEDIFNHKRKKYPIKMYIYEDDKKYIGYSLVVDEYDKKNYYAWYGGVIAGFQGKKITSNFFEFLISLARENDYHSVTLATHNNKPHMLILAIKMGFDIYNIKIRDDENGNKIYLKYVINKENKEKEIDLVDYSFIGLERLIVNIYKANYVSVRINKYDNIDKLIYLLNYFSSFEFVPTIFIKKTNLLDHENFIKTVKHYKGEVILID